MSTPEYDLIVVFRDAVGGDMADQLTEQGFAVGDYFDIDAIFEVVGVTETSEHQPNRVTLALASVKKVKKETAAPKGRKR